MSIARKCDGVSRPITTGAGANESLLTAALEYAGRGWRVFPIYEPVGDGRCSCGDQECGSPAKHPRIRGGFKNATTDATVIQGWWSRWPSASVGIATGTVSGLWVLDVDVKPGATTLADLEERFGDLSGVPAVTTGSGGLHFYFAGGDVAVPRRTGLLPGVDVRGEGGYVVAPSSLHISMNRYRWGRP